MCAFRSLSTTLMKLVGILFEVYFYLLPAPLPIQLFCLLFYLHILFSFCQSHSAIAYFVQILLQMVMFASRLHQVFPNFSFSFTFRFQIKTNVSFLFINLFSISLISHMFFQEPSNLSWNMWAATFWECLIHYLLFSFIILLSLILL